MFFFTDGVMLHRCCCVMLCHLRVVATLLLLSCCCSHCMVNMGVLDRGWVQVGHIALPGMLQPLLVSAGDEEQVECTCFLENTDRQTDGKTDTSCCHCHRCHHIHLAHRGGGLRASAGGPSSITWDAVAIVVCRGGGPRGA